MMIALGQPSALIAICLRHPTGRFMIHSSQHGNVPDEWLPWSQQVNEIGLLCLLVKTILTMVLRTDRKHTKVNS